jgi:HTH-type transcriptional regulator / antitoxin HigA
MGAISINEYYPDMVFHPGETLREKLDEMGMGPKEFAIRTSKPEKTISQVLNGESSITPDMAIKFEMVTRIKASFWMKLQRSYDEYCARLVYQEDKQEKIAWARLFDYPKMSSLGWVPQTKNVEEKMLHLLNFFQVSDHHAWRKYFFEKELSGTFRLSLNGAKNPYNLSAWMRQGEIMHKNDHPIIPYSKSGLMGIMPELKNMMRSPSPSYIEDIKSLCRSVGLNVIYVVNIPHAPHGVSRWINDIPMIQLSDKWQRYDIFCFTLMHEIAHILKHGVKFISLENVEYDDYDREREEEANQYASEQLLSSIFVEELASLAPHYRYSDIVKLAAKAQTHPSIIIGRLSKMRSITPQYAGILFKNITL